MYVLDTDHLSLLGRADNIAGQRIRRRLQPLPPNEAVTTIISFEEQVRGWTAALAQTRSLEQQIDVYWRLKLLLDRFCKMDVLDLDAAAVAEFKRLQQARVRIGTMDSKIAAITLTHNATLLTCNLVDFRKVPGLQVEDWSV
jgi:tRNA(fMet)-specific endonuclease VapC